MRETLRVAVVVGLIRGVFEWLPVSSEGNGALYLTGGAGLLVVLDAGVSGVEPLAAALALGTSAAVGYATIDGLLRVVQRIAFWLVCLVLGGSAVVGGVLAGVV